jgi:hypothetical protein
MGGVAFFMEGFMAKIELEIDSENWFGHENEHGFRFIAFQPTSTQVFGNQDGVVLTFADDDAGIGFQLWLSH